MSNYVVGDIQGCYSGLIKLLGKADFNPKKDKLWAVGDLIARGPESLKTLSYLHNLGDSFDCVLGNHDLHFLAIHAGLKLAKKNDDLTALLESKKVDKFVQWLRTKPLAKRINKHTLICHAGLYAQWSFSQAELLSEEVSAELSASNYKQLLVNMYGAEPKSWDPSLQGYDRLRFIINAFTRMRFITAQNELEFETKSSPTLASKNLRPWFTIENTNIKKKQLVLFGHWATLMGKTHSSQFIGLDTGYVWGHKMTMYCVEQGKLISIG